MGSTTGTVTSSTGTPITTQFYDLHGRLIANTDANGNVNKVSYNAADELIRETHADGGVKKYTYSAFGERTEIQDEGLFRTRNAYDRNGRLTDVVQEVVGETFTGAASGLVDGNFSMALPASGIANRVWRHFDYDGSGHQTLATTGEVMNDGVTPETQRYFYDLRGNMIKSRTPLG